MIEVEREEGRGERRKKSGKDNEDRKTVGDTVKRRGPAQERAHLKSENLIS